MRRLLLLLLLAACGRPSAGLRPGEVLLQVSAAGRSEVQPDQARLTLGVVNTAREALPASAANAQSMDRIAKALAALGVAAPDIQTKQVSLQHLASGPQKGQFEARNLIEVRVRQIDKAGAVIAAAAGAGGNLTSGPNLEVSDPGKADNAAYAAAYKAALARAETYAAAAGLKLRRILVIRDGDLADDTFSPEEVASPMMDMAPAPAPPPVSAGTDTRQVTVRVDFALAR